MCFAHKFYRYYLVLNYAPICHIDYDNFQEFQSTKEEISSDIPNFEKRLSNVEKQVMKQDSKLKVLTANNFFLLLLLFVTMNTNPNSCDKLN